MSDDLSMVFDVAWSPRLLQCGRTTRLALRCHEPAVDQWLGGFTEVDRRWSARQATLYLYLRAPAEPGDEQIRFRLGAHEATCRIGVRTLEQLRRPVTHRGVSYPRCWPLASPSTPSVKIRQVLDDLPLSTPDPASLSFWLDSDDETVWRQLPAAELPRAHFVNCHQGCPGCGTDIFRHGGFYPWLRTHRPGDFKSTCPECGLAFPDNDVLAGDFSGASSGADPERAIVDDGYGYVDADGHLFLFTATFCRDQTRAYGAGIGAMAAHVRATGAGDPTAARRLGLMLLRYAAEEVYLAAVPQFRYGPSLGTELQWEWTTTGQTDWASQDDPVASLYRMGSQRYSIDTPYITETLAVAYDTVWPLMREDEGLVEGAAACGLELDSPAAAVELVEEMLRCLLQVHLDGGASSNLPRVSEGVLVALRALQRGDGQDALAWIYDEGPDELRVFTTNDFFPDGTPPEATGGYNNIHTNGLFALEHHLRRLKSDRPGDYDEEAFPSMLADPRAARVVLAPHEIAMTGGAFVGFGDGGGPAVQAPLPADAYHAPLAPRSLAWAAEYTADAEVRRLQAAVTSRQHLSRGMTILDGVGLAVLRSDGVPERAAVGVVYGDTSGHRHQDLLDVQLWLQGQPFLSDLGYPQSWASRVHWEGHWATHNSVWATIPGLTTQLAGRGRVVRSLETEGLQLIEIEAARWTQDAGHWQQTVVTFRRLLALLQTDGEGVVLVDLSRVTGGDEHFRLCRGLEGTLEIAGAGRRPRPGTLAGESTTRGQVDGVAHPDHGGLAWMDDVEEVGEADGWRGLWRSRHVADAQLELHVLRAHGARAFTARATATMGTPAASTYAYRTICWRRAVEGASDGPSCFDLVFEPRHGVSSLARVTRIETQDPSATGVAIETRAGRRLSLRWNPEAGRADDGAAPAVEVDLDGRSVSVLPPRTGRIVALDRGEGWIEVIGLDGIRPGDRLVINPTGRGRNYAVVKQRSLDDGQRLWLDVTSVLGRSRVESVEEHRVLGRFAILTRTGYLHGARLCAGLEGEAEAVEIVRASNPDPHHTWMELRRKLEGAGVGDWVWAVDYIVGDPLQWEPPAAGGNEERVLRSVGFPD